MIIALQQDMAFNDAYYFPIICEDYKFYDFKQVNFFLILFKILKANNSQNIAVKDCYCHQLAFDFAFKKTTKLEGKLLIQMRQNYAEMLHRLWPERKKWIH